MTIPLLNGWKAIIRNTSQKEEESVQKGQNAPSRMSIAERKRRETDNGAGEND